MALLLLPARPVGLGGSFPVPFGEVLLRCAVPSVLCLVFISFSGEAAQGLQDLLLSASCVAFPYGVCFLLTLVSETYCGHPSG